MKRFLLFGALLLLVALAMACGDSENSVEAQLPAPQVADPTATATPEALTVLSKFRLFDDKSWTVPTLHGTRLYARDGKTITALDLG